MKSSRQQRGKETTAIDKKVRAIEHRPSDSYGVCCSPIASCSLSYENESFGQLSQLLQRAEGPKTLKERLAGFTRLFQRNTATCSVCHQPVAYAASLSPGRDIDAKRLDRVLRLRNQLLGLEVLPV